MYSRHLLLVTTLIVTTVAIAACSNSQASKVEPTPTLERATPVSTPTSRVVSTPTPEPPTVTPSPPSPTPTLYPENYELPDLHTLPPSGWLIEGPAHARTLRFASHVANLGHGPLILLGTVEAAEGRVHAVQRIRTSDGEQAEHEIGYFVWFGWHGHWHFEDFNVFELWTYGEGGELMELVASSGKASWCITETGLHQPLPEIYDPYAILGGCDARMQALATGWVDTYERDLHGQELSLGDLPDGRYAFVSTVNPDGRILELDDSGNTLVTYIEIRGYSVTVIEGP